MGVGSVQGFDSQTRRGQEGRHGIMGRIRRAQVQQLTTAAALRVPVYRELL